MIRRGDLMESAEKLVAKGRLQAAVKEYRKILQSSPRDTNTLNRLGDLYARLEQVGEAVKMFRQIADHYRGDGFFVKAIAIYKKILRLDPTQLDVYETLAELYHRQGLTSEARGQYQVVADYHVKHGDRTAAIRIVQRLVELDPDRLSERAKLAELHLEAGQRDDALRQFQKIADLLLAHSHVDEATKVYVRALEATGAADFGFITDAVLGLRERGHAAAAQKVLEAAIERNPEAHRVARLAGSAGEAATRQQQPAEPSEEPAGLQDVAVAPAVEAVEPEEEPAAVEPPATVRPPVEPAAAEEALMEDGEGEFILDLDEVAADAAATVEAEPSAPPMATDEVAPPEEGVEPSPARPPAVDLDLDLSGLEPALSLPEPRPRPGRGAGRPWIDHDELERSAAQVRPPARREDDLIAEAEVFVKYGLERKAIERLVEVLQLNVQNLEARGRLIQIFVSQEAHEEAVAEARQLARLARELDLPEPWDAARRELARAGYRIDGERIQPPARSAPEELPLEPAPQLPMGQPAPAPPAAADLEWLEPAAAPGAGEKPAAIKVFDEEEEFFDLAAELERELGDEADLGLELPQPPGREESLKEIVDGFRKGVEERLSPRDFDTHYNLGIAYREMGLMDEAIGEFQLAAKDPRYLVDCCSMLGQCFLDKGFPELAIKWYRQGLESPAIAEGETLGLLYELGALYDSVGDRASALSTFVEIYGLNSGYRDVVARLEELGHGR